MENFPSIQTVIKYHRETYMKEVTGDRNAALRSLKKLLSQVLDPRNGILVGGNFRTPYGYVRHCINVSEILNRTSFRELLIEASVAMFPIISHETGFTTILSYPGTAEVFTNLLRSIILDISRDTRFCILPTERFTSSFREVNISHLKGENVLIILDSINTGGTARRLTHIVMNSGARSAALLSMVKISGASDLLWRSSDAEYMPFQKYTLLEIPDQILGTQYDKNLVPEELYTDFIVDTPHIITVFSEINETVKQYLAKHPERIYDFSSRNFEELVASILKDFGFEVELTKTTRDGGRDIIAYIRSAVCSVLTYVECKKYAPDKKVGVEVVRSVYGVHNIHKPNKSLIVAISESPN